MNDVLLGGWTDGWMDGRDGYLLAGGTSQADKLSYLTSIGYGTWTNRAVAYNMQNLSHLPVFIP